MDITDKRKIMVVIPTYNEKECIAQIISDINREISGVFITVVDDNSPDGTGDIVNEIASNNQRVYVIHRKEKRGLGSAYLDGFRYALESQADYIIEMDADLSHDPKHLSQMLKLINDYDVVLGSRYVRGVRVHNWPFSRLLLSKIANLFVKILLKLPLEDSTSGYKCYRREVLEAIDLNNIKSNGYAFQIEMVFWAIRKGFSIIELPIMFSERHGGVTKMSKVIAWEAFLQVFRLKLINLKPKLAGFKKNRDG